jgi:hypothetical protein
MCVVAVLVDHELPETAVWVRSAEVCEVEGEHGEVLMRGDRHDRRVCVAEVKIRKRGVELHRTPPKPRRKIYDRMLARSYGLEEQTCGMAPEAGSQQLIDLDDHRLGNEQVASKLAHQACGECVRSVASIRRSNKRPGVRDDLQRASTSSCR